MHLPSLVVIVTLLSLVLLMVTMGRVGRARYKFGVKAPATTGHDEFERHFRVQMNTIEQIILFLPSLWLFAIYWQNAVIAFLLGMVWLAGRVLYMISYAKDPATRALGFGLTVLPTMILMIGAGVGVVRAMLSTGGT